MDSLFLERASVALEPRLRLIASEEAFGIPATVTETGLARVLDLLQQKFNFIIADIPMPLPPAMVRTSPPAIQVVTVLTPDAASLRDTQNIRRFVAGLTGPDRMISVLNRADMKGGMRAGSDRQGARRRARRDHPGPWPRHAGGDQLGRSRGQAGAGAAPPSGAAGARDRRRVRPNHARFHVAAQDCSAMKVFGRRDTGAAAVSAYRRPYRCAAATDRAGASRSDDRRAAGAGAEADRSRRGDGSDAARAAAPVRTDDPGNRQRRAIRTVGPRTASPGRGTHPRPAGLRADRAAAARRRRHRHHGERA